MSDPLAQAADLIASNRSAEARALLQSILRADRANEDAWLLYAQCVETPAERIQALKLCLRFNPAAARARAALDALRTPPASPPPFTVPPDQVPQAVYSEAAARAEAEAAAQIPSAGRPAAGRPAAQPTIRPLKIQLERRRRRLTGDLPPIPPEPPQPPPGSRARRMVYIAAAVMIALALLILLAGLWIALSRPPF